MVKAADHGTDVEGVALMAVFVSGWGWTEAFICPPRSLAGRTLEGGVQNLFSAVDVDGQEELITYCTIGGRAVTAWFVAHLNIHQRQRKFIGGRMKVVEPYVVVDWQGFAEYAKPKVP
jgi:hypothetical protein